MRRTQTLGIAPGHDLVAVADAQLERAHADHLALRKALYHARKVDRVVKIAAYLPRHATSGQPGPACLAYARCAPSVGVAGRRTTCTSLQSDLK